MPLTAESLESPTRKGIEMPVGATTVDGDGFTVVEETKDEDIATDDKPVGKTLTFEEKVTMYREKLGGKENLEKMAHEWNKYAEKVRKDAKKQKNMFDFTLDLVDSCSNGDYLKVGAILSGGANPNQEVNDLNLYLFVAGKIVFLDVQMGFVNEGDVLGSEQSNLQRVLEMLSRFGANMNFRGPDGMNALHLAAASGDARFVKFLCEGAYACDPNYRSKDGLTALMYAAKYGHALTMAPIVLQGGDFNIVDPELRTPLHYAALTGQTRSAQFLIRIGSSKAAKDKDGYTPGQLASEAGFPACAQAIYAFARPRIAAEPQLQYMLDGIRGKTAKGAARPATTTAMLTGALTAGFTAAREFFTSVYDFFTETYDQFENVYMSIRSLF
jgi:hypothetical protein